MKLMIKRHQDTGLKYLHYTNKDTSKSKYYLGSGKYWKRHLKKHGNNVISCLFLESDNQKLMTNYALHISEKCNVVESEGWANLVPEDCLRGGSHGPCSEETKQKIGDANRGKPGTKGLAMSEESRYKMSLAKKGKYDGGKNPNAKSVCVNGIVYDNIKKAAVDNTITYEVMKWRIKNPKFTNYYLT